jgi:hypothetical protein
VKKGQNYAMISLAPDPDIPFCAFTQVLPLSLERKRNVYCRVETSYNSNYKLECGLSVQLFEKDFLTSRMIVHSSAENGFYEQNFDRNSCLVIKNSPVDF